VTETARPLDVVADLTVTVDDETIRVRGYGDLVVVRAPTLDAVRSLATMRSALDLSRRADVTVDVRVRGHSVARAGPGEEPGRLSRLLGVAPARLSLGGVLLSLLN
jgi:hypothetical protein